jgi:hypothetical protein
MQQQQLQAVAQEKEADRMFEASENQKDRETDIRKAIIGTMGFDDDIQGNAVNDIVQYGELSLKQIESQRSHELAREKNDNEKKKADQEANLKERELELKDKEIKSKERIAKDNNRTALKNKVAGEK